MQRLQWNKLTLSTSASFIIIWCFSCTNAFPDSAITKQTNAANIWTKNSRCHKLWWFYNAINSDHFLGCRRAVLALLAEWIPIPIPVCTWRNLSAQHCGQIFKFDLNGEGSRWRSSSGNHKEPALFYSPQINRLKRGQLGMKSSEIMKRSKKKIHLVRQCPSEPKNEWAYSSVLIRRGMKRWNLYRSVETWKKGEFFIML